MMIIFSQEEKEESSSGDQAGCGLGGQTSSFGLGGHQTSSGNFVQTIQCDVTLKVNETIKVILRKMHEDHWEVKLLNIETPFLVL